MVSADVLKDKSASHTQSNSVIKLHAQVTWRMERMFVRFRNGLELDSASQYKNNKPLRKVGTLYYPVWKPLRMPSSAKHVLLLCLKFTLQSFFQITLFTVTPIILMNMFHRHTVWRLLSMVPSLQVPADDDFPYDTAAVLGATIKETHVITTTTRLEAICFNNAFFYSKSCPFSADIIGLRVLTWNYRDFQFVSCQSLSPSPPGLPLRRIQFVLILVSSDGALSHSDFILNFFMIIQCHKEVNMYSICSVGLYHMLVCRFWNQPPCCWLSRLLLLLFVQSENTL